MKDILEATKFLLPHSFARDLIFLVSGISSLFVLNILFNFNLNDYPNFLVIGDLGKFIVLISISYIFARLLREVAVNSTNLALFFFEKKKIEKIKNWYSDIVKIANHDVEIVNLTANGEILEGEIDSFVSKNKGMSLQHERMILVHLVDDISLGFSIVLSILYSPIILLISFIFLIKSMNNRCMYINSKTNLARLFAKNRTTGTPD